jgi:hypothetical protein
MPACQIKERVARVTPRPLQIWENERGTQFVLIEREAEGPWLALLLSPLKRVHVESFEFHHFIGYPTW